MRHILIVDSDSTAALVTQHGLQMLLKHEVDVTTALLADGEWQRRVADKVDLLIIDPGGQTQVTGKVLKTLLSEQPGVGVLILTAYDSPGLRKQMQTIGVQHYLAKPIDLHDLERVVRRALGLS